MKLEKLNDKLEDEMKLLLWKLFSNKVWCINMNVNEIYISQIKFLIKCCTSLQVECKWNLYILS